MMVKKEAPSCPTCKSDDMNCLECGNLFPYCDCPFDHSDTMDLYCFGCDDYILYDLHDQKTRLARSFNWDDEEGYHLEEEYEDDDYDIDDDFGKADDWDTPGYVVTKGGSSGAYGMWSFASCRHNDLMHIPAIDKYVLATSSRIDKRRHWPDFGLYADWFWTPSGWRVEHIDWPDFDVPSNTLVAYDAIISAYERIESGQLVEVGCLGGHGRTGVLLASFLILSGMPADSAIDYVREVYCQQAIENGIQEYWLACFEHDLYGGPEPKKNKAVLRDEADPCAIEIHHQMWKENKKLCPDCKYFYTDVKIFEENKKKTQTKREKILAKQEEKKQKKENPKEKYRIKKEDDTKELKCEIGCSLERHHDLYLQGTAQCDKCEFLPADILQFLEAEREPF